MYILMSLIMFPLQNVNNVQLFGQGFKKSAPNPNTIYFVVVLGIIVFALIIFNNVRNKYKPTKTGGKQASSDSAGPRNFSGFTLHRITSDLGLDREQVKMLEYILRSGGVSDPVRLLNSPELLDRHFKRTYRLIERTSASEEELNERLSMLFATRNIIESRSGNAVATSSRQVPEKVAAVLTVGQATYPVKVISSRGDTLVVENPKTNTGALVRLAKGSKANLSFFTKSVKGFSVETRILSSADSASGPVLQLAHSGQIKRLSSRRFRRREISISAHFFLVQIDSGTRKMTVDKQKRSGHITDISIGGCSFKTNIPVRVGQKLKVEFARDDNTTVAALGEVLRTSRTGTSTVLHIKFLKVPRRSLNSINAMVYEYAE